MVKLKRPDWIPRWITVPLLIFLAFITLLLFFGDYNYIQNNEYNNTIKQLKAEIKANEDSALIYQHKLNELNTDKASLEKIARERYGMKRASEDVYQTDIP